MEFIESNIDEQIEQLQNNSMLPQYISMSKLAYDVYSQGFAELPKEYKGMIIIVNPYQVAEIVVLSDCITEHGKVGWLN